MTTFEANKNIGEIAEKIVTDRIESKGRIIYAPITEGKHLIDGMVVNPIDKSMIGIEVKKQRPFDWHGVKTYTMPLRNWIEYCDFVAEFKMDVLLFVVDTMRGKISFAHISSLNTPKWVKNGEKSLVQYPLMLRQIEFRSWRHDKMLLPVSWFQEMDDMTSAELAMFK